MAVKFRIENISDDGAAGTVQEDGHAPQTLLPGQETIVIVDKDNEAILSEEENGY